MNWREWMHKRLVEGPPPTELLKRLRSPGNKNILDDLARHWGRGYWSLPWTRLRVFHMLDKGAPEGEVHQAVNLFTRLKVAGVHPGLPNAWRDVLKMGQRRIPKRSVLLDEDEFERIMQVHVAGGASTLAFRMAYYCGILPNSLRRARVEDFHRIGGKYMFYERGRLITIPEHLVPEFEAHVGHVMATRSANKHFLSPTLFVVREIKGISSHPEITATLAALRNIRH